MVRLIAVEKICDSNRKETLSAGNFSCEMASVDGRDLFHLDYSRSNMELKYKMQIRYSFIYPLLRLDFGSNSYHINPNTVFACDPSDPFFDVHEMYVGHYFPRGAPHMHIYRENFLDKWAYPIPESFRNLRNPYETFDNFMRFCNIIKGPSLYKGIDEYDSG